MSLRAVHILFIVASIVLAVFMGGWGIVMFRSPLGSVGHLATGVVSCLVAAVLSVYAVGFIRKTRRIGIE